MKTEMVKCYYGDGSYTIKFMDEHGEINGCNDMSGLPLRQSQFTKIEPLEQPDTLQEVVDWCKENQGRVEVTYDELFEVNDNGKYLVKTELLEHIRAPKLKQITPEELAEMGYEIVNK